MEIAGEQILPMPRERVWAALNDPEILRVSVPGCESLERVDENHYKVVMAATVGPVKARFNGKLLLTDLNEPTSYSLNFEGSGGAAGFGKGGAHVNLESDGEGTRLVYRAHAQVGGRLAQVGARLIDGVARKMAEEFFRHFTSALTSASEGEQEAASQDKSSDSQSSGAVSIARRSAAPARKYKLWLWAAGFAAAVAMFAAYRMH